MTFKAVAVAAALITAAVPTFAMESEVNELTGKLYNTLASRGISTEGLQDLTMAEILQIEQILANGDSNGEMVSAVRSILKN